MAGQSKKTSIVVAVLIGAIVVAIVIVWTVVKPKPARTTDLDHMYQPDQNHPAAVHPTADRPAEAISPRMSLTDVIAAARTWGPDFGTWFGRETPEFTLTDITGKQHKLTDYRGKDVMIIFWASWCGPCRMEIPHLIELRKTVSQDKLAMLAISYITPHNTTEMVKDFVAQNGEINYAVFSVNPSDMPAPYSLVNSIPCSFFINPEGKIKLATVGLLSLSDMRGILQAPSQADWP